MKSTLKYFLAAIVCLGCVFSLHAQSDNIQIEGAVLDSLNGDPLASATVVLLQPEDSVMTAFNICGNEGQFILRRVPPGEYLLQVTYLGYESKSVLVEFDGSSKVVDYGQVLMRSSAEMLDGATISEERIPVRVKKDTIIYNADAFRVEPNANVEDLLKRMPGIEVDADGAIKAEGEDVEKILVDGKEFFGSDPKMATKNLPARAIKEVQVFDRKSDATTFTGIDDGIRSKTINLKLKEDFKKGMFGSVEGGYGTEERYNGKFNLNSFSKNTQLSTIGQLNNINEQGFSVNEYINFLGGMGSLMRSGGHRIDSRTSAIPISSGVSNGDVETGGVGANLNHDFSKKTKLNATYFYSDVSQFIEESTTRNYFQSSGDFETNETDLTGSDNQRHRISTRLDHDIDSTQNIRLNSSLTLSQSSFNSDTYNETITKGRGLENSSQTLNMAENETVDFSVNLVYRKKFNKPGRSVVGEVNYGHSPEESDTDLNSINNFFTGTNMRTDSILQDQIDDSDAKTYGFSTTWTEPIGKKSYLGIGYSYDLETSNSTQDVFDIVKGGNKIRNEALSNAYEQKTQWHLAELSNRWIFDKSNLNIRLGVQHSTLDGQLLLIGEEVQSEFTNLLPSLNYNYDFSRTKGISVSYRTQINQPTIQQLQPIIDNSDPLNIYVGNPGLKPEYNHNINLRFRNFSQFSNTSLFGNIRLNITENNIVNSTVIDEEFVRTITPVNIDNTFNGTAWMSYGAPLRFLGARISLNTQLSYTDNVTFINSLATDTRRWSNSYGLSLANSKDRAVDWRCGIDLNHSNTKYENDSQQSQKYNGMTYWGETTISLGSWVIKSTMDVDLFGDNFTEGTQSIYLWTASVSKFVMQRKLEIRVSAFDLLNENRGYSQNATLNYIEEQQSNSLSQYFMASVVYTIGNFSQAPFQITGPRGRR